MKSSVSLKIRFRLPTIMKVHFFFQMVYCYPGAGGEVAGLRVAGGVPGYTVALHRQLPNQQGGYLE